MCWSKATNGRNLGKSVKARLRARPGASLPAARDPALGVHSRPEVLHSSLGDPLLGGRHGVRCASRTHGATPRGCRSADRAGGNAYSRTGRVALVALHRSARRSESPVAAPREAGRSGTPRCSGRSLQPLGGQGLDEVVDRLDTLPVALVDGLRFRHTARMPARTAASRARGLSAWRPLCGDGTESGLDPEPGRPTQGQNTGDGTVEPSERSG
jgi:hypothetical protein